MHDVFISYSSCNKDIADAICHHLENNDVKCWYAPRDVVSGDTWAASIVRAIADARIMVLVYSENSNRSDHVLREVSHAVSHECCIIPFRIDESPMNDALGYYLQPLHWLDAVDPPLERNLDKLCRRVKSYLNPVPDVSSPAVPDTPAEKVPATFSIKKWILLLASAVLLVGLVAAIWKHSSQTDHQSTAVSSPEKATASPEKQESAPDAGMENINFYYLSDLENHNYPFYGTCMFTYDMDMCFVQDKESGLLSLIKTESGFRIISDIDYSFTSPQNVLILASSTSQYIYFLDISDNTIQIYDRTKNNWVSNEPIRLPVEETEFIVTPLYNIDAITGSSDKNQDISFIMCDGETGICNAIIYLQPDGSCRKMDISQHNLISFVLGLIRSDIRCVFMRNQYDQLKLLNIETGELLDVPHEELVHDYIPDSSKDSSIISPNKRYLRMDRNLDHNGNVVIWDLHTGQQVFNEVFTKNYSLFFTGDSEITYYNCEDYSLRSYDLETGNKRLILDKSYFNNYDIYSTYPYAFYYSDVLDQFFFSRHHESEEGKHTNTLIAIERDGTPVASSGELDAHLEEYYTSLIAMNGKLFYVLTSTTPEDEEICTTVYRCMYTWDENGKLTFPIK